MQLILLNGAPGTGKTTIAAKLHEITGGPWFEFGWIPEFRKLNPHTDITYEDEETMSYENLTLVVRNYLRHGFENVIISDLSDARILEMNQIFADTERIVVTLTADDAVITERIRTRDNGNEYRDTEAAVKINHATRIREPLANELRIDTGSWTPEEICRMILSKN